MDNNSTLVASMLDARIRTASSTSSSLMLMLSELKEMGPQGTWLGSRKLGPGTPEYIWLAEVARLLAVRGIAAKTGGGPGLMEAPHLGCQQADRSDLAIAICADFLKAEEGVNPCVREGGHIFSMPDFSSRHDGLFYGSTFFGVLPGRLGTFHELYDMINRMKHGLLTQVPVYFIERQGYWSHVMEFVTRPLGIELGPRISPQDFDLAKIVDIRRTSPSAFVQMLLNDIGLS
jgi:predicted Rossmann-fold nucleotide-binding protein